MPLIKAMSRIMEHPTVYKLWQAPFAEAKMEPVLRHNSLDTPKRVLDVGCGPGTNCSFFLEHDYRGFDINPAYIEVARKKFQRRFDVQDVCTFQARTDERFDFVLLNSLLHHLNDDDTRRILQQVELLLSSEGCVHIIDLVLPDRMGIPRWLARNDRGDFPRSLSKWTEMFSSCFTTVVAEPFAVRAGGIKLWELIYFKGSRRK